MIFQDNRKLADNLFIDRETTIMEDSMTNDMQLENSRRRHTASRFKRRQEDR